MKRNALLLTSILPLGLAAAGCGDGRVFKQAQTAEKRGKPELAYEEYCKAAVDQPGSGAVAQGLDRTREAAAAFWEKRALIAMDERRYVDAWRMLMRVLEIEPDEVSSADLIRQLESEHPDELDEAKTEYLRRGSVALAATLRQEKSLAGMSPSMVLSETTVAQRPAEAQLTMTDTRGKEKAAPAAELATPAESTPTPKARKKLGKRSSANRGTIPPREGRAAGVFEMVCTLSKRDTRYSRTVTILDGVELRLKETDDDPDVDLDVFCGQRRLKKLRSMEIGETQSFATSDGRLFRLTILSIHDPSKTVRVGIRPA